MKFRPVPKHKLTENEVRMIRGGLHYHGRDSAIARMLGVSSQTVSNARRGFLYKTITRGETTMTSQEQHQPVCPNCGKPALDGHITCGEYACGEHKFREQRRVEWARKQLLVVPSEPPEQPITCEGRPVRWPNGKPVLARDLIPGASYELTEDGVLFNADRGDF